MTAVNEPKDRKSLAICQAAEEINVGVALNNMTNFKVKLSPEALILGSGNSAYALSCYLIAQGFEVSLLVRSQAKLNELANLTIVANGLLNDSYKLKTVTADTCLALKTAKTIFITTITTAYPEIAAKLAPFLTPEHNIILFSSKFGGVLEFAKVLANVQAQYSSLLETDALFPCRIQGDGSINIKGIKNWTLFSAINPSQTVQDKDILLNYFPKLAPAQNIVQRGLTDFGALAHPLIMLLNMNKIDKNLNFSFYKEGFTEKTIVLMEALEQEFMSIGRAYGTSIIPMSQLLNRYYGCDASSLYKAIQSVRQYEAIQSPQTLNHRFIEEDVASSLVPMYHFAKLAGIKIPLIKSLISLASILYGIDFKNTGRSLDRLGLASLSYEEIYQRLNE